ncbi:NUDIX domain-containing protein [Paenibacillus lycopersici]|uniref:NUDIX domain-containing protein n=1 Tax=Paenibacillus lycopersici TaxID=2704462 RepID=A0A6C0G809_9BACL|nr:NUDIX domain-containing protein [Paenibacillus lycopersici]
MNPLDEARFPVLAKPARWGSVTSKFSWIEDAGDLSLVSNVSIVPFVGELAVMMRLEDGRWELPGGTLNEGEHYLDGLRREMMEELGAELVTYRLFGHFECESSAPAPYRPYIPHPRFRRLIGYGDVAIVGQPLNPDDGEQVVRVEAMPIEEAVRLFEASDRPELAELYLAGYRMRVSV